MKRFLKFLGGLLSVALVVTLIISAAMLFMMIGDAAPAMVVGLVLLVGPCLYWLFRQFRKIDWGE